MSSQFQGKEGESLAEDYLIRNGHTIIRKNFRNYLGEIDIISLKDSTLYFIEVKNWKSDKYIHPLEIFTQKKIRIMRTLASVFIAEDLEHQNYLVSFCLIKITDDEVSLYTDLF